MNAVQPSRRLPVVDLDGSARQRGLAHGEALRVRIARGLEVMAMEVGATRERPLAAICSEFLAATSFTGAIERWTPGLLDEVRGIADGAGSPHEVMLAYNLLDEWGWYSRLAAAHAAPPRGCSAIGLHRGNGGCPVVGQTHDLPADYADTMAVLRVHPEGVPTALVLTAAGAIALSGINAAGVSVNCNSLVAWLPHSASGLPVAFLVRAVLAERSLAAARRLVEAVPHASGQNYLLGGPEGICDLECSAAGVVEVDAGLEVALHTNHPVGMTRDAGSTDADSRARLALLESRRATLRSAADVREALRTPPVCNPSETVAAILGELCVPPRVSVCAGAPDAARWTSLGFERGIPP